MTRAPRCLIYVDSAKLESRRDAGDAVAQPLSRSRRGGAQAEFEANQQRQSEA